MKEITPKQMAKICVKLENKNEKFYITPDNRLITKQGEYQIIK
jgi:hypothetical protein